MPSSTRPFTTTLFRILLLPALLSYLYLNFYPAINDCAFPPAQKVRTTCSGSTCKNTTVNAGKAPFRLLALADPQLEGDTSLPPALRNSGSAWGGLGILWDHASAGDMEGLRRDFPVIFQGYRKKLDLWGTDLYLAHVFSRAKSWASPTHTVVLGDLVGSQWIGDGEFESRAERFWGRVLGGRMVRVPDFVMAKEKEEGHEGEVLGEGDGAREWRRRVIAVAGNHDVGYAGDLNDARVERFERSFGRVNWEVAFRLPNSSLDEGNSFAKQTSLDFYDGPGPQPELRLVVLNSMNLDEPALRPALREQSLAFMRESLCSPDRFHDDEHSATVLLTHIPLHKPTGLCVDGPFFSYFSNGGGIREQNHLSEDLSKKLVGCLQRKRSAVILNGHDHEGCNSLHYREPLSSTSSITNAGDEGDGEGIQQTIPYRELSPNQETSSSFVREITVRSMMGSYGGHAGFLSGWFDVEKGKWEFEYASCGFGVQHIWWVCNVLLYLEAGLGGVWVVGMLVGGMVGEGDGRGRRSGKDGGKEKRA